MGSRADGRRAVESWLGEVPRDELGDQLLGLRLRVGRLGVDAVGRRRDERRAEESHEERETGQRVLVERDRVAGRGQGGLADSGVGQVGGRTRARRPAP